MKLDRTHDPELESWVESANAPGDFPLQNLPFGVFRRKGTKEKPRGGVAIGDQVFDLAALGMDTGPTLNALAAAGPRTWRELRQVLSQALSRKGYRKKYVKHLLPMTRAELFLPVAIGSFVAGPLGGWLVERYVRGSANPTGMWWIVAGIGFAATLLMVLYDRFVAAGPGATATGGKA